MGIAGTDGGGRSAKLDDRRILDCAGNALQHTCHNSISPWKRGSDGDLHPDLRFETEGSPDWGPPDCPGILCDQPDQWTDFIQHVYSPLSYGIHKFDGAGKPGSRAGGKRH